MAWWPRPHVGPEPREDGDSSDRQERAAGSERQREALDRSIRLNCGLESVRRIREDRFGVLAREG